MIYGITESDISLRGWVRKKEVEYTHCRELIFNELKHLVDEATWVELRTPGYRSPPTILIEVTEGHIQVDRPVDWKGGDEIVITYKRKGEPWNFMKSNLLKEDEKVLFLKFPTTWAILERREYFRIPCPSMSIAKCIQENGPIVAGNVSDISLQGICLETSSKEEDRIARVREVFDIIALTLRLRESREPFCLDVKKGGEVRRVQQPGRFSKYIFRLGIKLFTDEREKDIISKYIRKREIELLALQKDK